MRTKAHRGVELLLLLATLAATTRAQSPTPPTGTVTGHVICQDTQKPARFAQVELLAIPASITPMSAPSGTDSKSTQAFIKQMTDAMSSVSFILSETGFDGSFTIDGVAPGDYYVMASVAGYVQPHELVQAAYDAGQDLTKGISGVPIVHVSAEHSSGADITVARGGAIEGHVLWDDGVPVNAADVSAQPKSGEHKQLPPQFTMIQMTGVSRGETDDRGHYRISGLAPGEYTVRATLQTNRRMAMQRGRFDGSTSFGAMPLTVYAPGGFRKTDAKPLTLTAGEERTDEDITFNISSTHSVSGAVTSAEDHHGLNSGVVTLTDTTDTTFKRSGGLDADGNFTITFVPPGTYTMAIAHAADTVPEEPKPTDSGFIMPIGAKTIRSYQKAEQQIIVTDSDLSGQNLELKPDKAGGSSEAGGESTGEGVIIQAGPGS